MYACMLAYTFWVYTCCNTDYEIVSCRAPHQSRYLTVHHRCNAEAAELSCRDAIAGAYHDNHDYRHIPCACETRVHSLMFSFQQRVTHLKYPVNAGERNPRGRRAGGGGRDGDAQRAAADGVGHRHDPGQGAAPPTVCPWAG